MRLTKWMLLAAVSALILPSANAVVCFETPVTARELLGAPAGAPLRLVMMTPRRDDEIGKLTLFRGDQRLTETVIWYTPGEPAHYGLEGDRGSFIGTDDGRTLTLNMTQGPLKVNGRDFVIARELREKGRAPRFQLTLTSEAVCRKMYPDQGKTDGI